MHLDDELRAELDREYVRRDNCKKDMDEQDKKFANDDKRLAVIETYQKITLGVLSAVGVGVLGIVLAVFSGGVV